MVVVPEEMPVTTPAVEIEPIADAELDQTPDGVDEDKVVVLPTHAIAVPEMALTVGTGFTVTVNVAMVVHPNPLVIV